MVLSAAQRVVDDSGAANSTTDTCVERCVRDACSSVMSLIDWRELVWNTTQQVSKNGYDAFRTTGR